MKTRSSSPTNSFCRARCCAQSAARQPSVLLIDEIDKADAEFEAFLLELLSDFQITVPELGTLKAKHIPLVILTSNNAREMSDALKRRCLHLYIDFPDKAQELAIIKTKIPDVSDKLAEQVVNVVQSLRKLDLKKTPGISESLDWVKALTLLNVKTLDEALVNETLDTIVKYEGDVRKAQEELKDYVEKSKARRGGVTPPGQQRQGFSELSPARTSPSGGSNRQWKKNWSSLPTCCARTACAFRSLNCWTRLTPAT